MKIKDFVTAQYMLESVRAGKSFAEIARAASMQLDRKVTRQWIQTLYKQYESEYPEEFKDLMKKELSESDITESITQTKYLKGVCSSKSISYGKLKKFMDKRDIKRKTLKDRLPKEKMFELYVTKGLTDKQIGDLYGYSKYSITALRGEYEITAQDRLSLYLKELQERGGAVI